MDGKIAVTYLQCTGSLVLDRFVLRYPLVFDSLQPRFLGLFCPRELGTLVCHLLPQLFQRLRVPLLLCVIIGRHNGQILGVLVARV